MSFILDALKKSEDQRRLGQPPDLNSPVRSTAGSRRPVWLVPGAVLLVLVLLSLFVWREYSGQGLLGLSSLVGDPDVTEPAGGGAPPPAQDLPALIEPPESGEQLAGGPDSESLAEAEEEEPAPRRERRRDTVDREVTAPQVSRRRVPEQTPDEEAEQRRLAAREAAIEQARIEAEREAEEREARLTRERLASIPDPGEVDPGRTEPDPDARRRPAEPEAEGEVWTPGGERREFVYRWELPAAVRRDMPELRLTMHVFSREPENRFVLVNSERFREGDEVAPGVRLAEINREGAVLDYRQYRFLLMQ